MNLFRIFGEDRLSHAGAQALAAKNDFFVALVLGRKRPQSRRFDRLFGGSAASLAVAGIFQDENVAGKFFHRMGPAARVSTVAMKEEKTFYRRVRSFKTPQLNSAVLICAEPFLET